MPVSPFSNVPGSNKHDAMMSIVAGSGGAGGFRIHLSSPRIVRYLALRLNTVHVGIRMPE